MDEPITLDGRFTMAPLPTYLTIFDVLRIYPDGRFELLNGATTDDAAKAIIQAARQMMPNFPEPQA